MEHMQKFPIAVRTYFSNSEQAKCHCEANHSIYKGDNKIKRGPFRGLIEANKLKSHITACFLKLSILCIGSGKHMERIIQDILLYSFPFGSSVFSETKMYHLLNVLLLCSNLKMYQT